MTESYSCCYQCHHLTLMTPARFKTRFVSSRYLPVPSDKLSFSNGKMFPDLYSLSVQWIKGPTGLGYRGPTYLCALLKRNGKEKGKICGLQIFRCLQTLSYAVIVLGIPINLFRIHLGTIFGPRTTQGLPLGNQTKNVIQMCFSVDNLTFC